MQRACGSVAGQSALAQLLARLISPAAVITVTSKLGELFQREIRYVSLFHFFSHFYQLLMDKLHMERQNIWLHQSNRQLHAVPKWVKIVTPKIRSFF